MNQITTEYLQCPDLKCQSKRVSQIVENLEVKKGETETCLCRMCLVCSNFQCRTIKVDGWGWGYWENILWDAWKKKSNYFSISEQEILRKRINKITSKKLFKENKIQGCCDE